MPYKDKNKQKEYQKQWSRNKFSNPDRRAERKQRRKNIHDEKRKKLAEYKKTLKCENCGENHPATLDFHHPDPNKKDMAVSKMIAAKKKWEDIEKEINKCMVLCANCHRKLHYTEQVIFS